MGGHSSLWLGHNLLNEKDALTLFLLLGNAQHNLFSSCNSAI